MSEDFRERCIEAGHLPCIEAEGYTNPKGYRSRHVTIGSRKTVVRLYQHRVAWEQAWGLTIPAGMVVRHSCDSPGCVNPLHLMIGTYQDNTDDMLKRGRHMAQKKTHCPQGHELIEGNLDLDQLKRGWRSCLICSRISSRESLRRRRRRQKEARSDV